MILIIRRKKMHVHVPFLYLKGQLPENESPRAKDPPLLAPYPRNLITGVHHFRPVPTCFAPADTCGFRVAGTMEWKKVLHRTPERRTKAHAWNIA